MPDVCVNDRQHWAGYSVLLWFSFLLLLVLYEPSLRSNVSQQITASLVMRLALWRATRLAFGSSVVLVSSARRMSAVSSLPSLPRRRLVIFSSSSWPRLLHGSFKLTDSPLADPA